MRGGRTGTANARRWGRNAASVILWIVVAAGVVVSSGCGGSSFRVRGQDYDEVAQEEMGPDAFVDRYGEADVWKSEKVGGELQITAIWRCVDGEYREMVWRTQQHEAGRGDEIEPG